MCDIIQVHQYLLSCNQILAFVDELIEIKANFLVSKFRLVLRA